MPSVLVSRRTRPARARAVSATPTTRIIRAPAGVRRGLTEVLRGPSGPGTAPSSCSPGTAGTPSRSPRLARRRADLDGRAVTPRPRRHHAAGAPTPSTARAARAGPAVGVLVTAIAARSTPRPTAGNLQALTADLPSPDVAVLGAATTRSGARRRKPDHGALREGASKHGRRPRPQAHVRRPRPAGTTATRRAAPARLDLRRSRPPGYGPPATRRPRRVGSGARLGRRPQLRCHHPAPATRAAGNFLGRSAVAP